MLQQETCYLVLAVASTMHLLYYPADFFNSSLVRKHSLIPFQPDRQNKHTLPVTSGTGHLPISMTDSPFQFLCPSLCIFIQCNSFIHKLVEYGHLKTGALEFYPPLTTHRGHTVVIETPHLNNLSLVYILPCTTKVNRNSHLGLPSLLHTILFQLTLGNKAS